MTLSVNVTLALTKILFGSDINECDSSVLNTCDHSCINEIGSFRCSCPNGYQLNPLNGRECYSKLEPRRFQKILRKFAFVKMFSLEESYRRDSILLFLYFLYYF